MLVLKHHRCIHFFALDHWIYETFFIRCYWSLFEWVVCRVFDCIEHWTLNRIVEGLLLWLPFYGKLFSWRHNWLASVFAEKLHRNLRILRCAPLYELIWVAGRERVRVFQCMIYVDVLWQRSLPHWPIGGCLYWGHFKALFLDDLFSLIIFSHCGFSIFTDEFFSYSIWSHLLLSNHF